MRGLLTRPGGAPPVFAGRSAAARVCDARRPRRGEYQRAAPRPLRRHARPRDRHEDGARDRRARQNRRQGSEERRRLRQVVAGERVKTGGKVVKNVAGYDLAKLFIGSLGTLGVITELTYRVSPLPEVAASFVAAGAM